MQGHVEIVQQLLDHGALVSLLDKQDRSALDYAQAKGFASIEEVIVQTSPR
jgi:hypothetical protein